MLPVTGTFLPAFAAYYVLLNIRVSVHRVATNTMIGTDTSKKSSSDSKPKTSSSAEQELIVNARVHANFIENVPLALLVASVVELNGGNGKVIGTALASLLFFRIAHAEFGLRAERAMGWGRPLGYFGTLAWVFGMSTYAAWLVKGYWSW
ncbi:hypothetical protein H2200_008523 [Cladophialophora chaetospira]|uniref:Uncharacterized protein n=1 Tax=Cladophialophora chaetospira TaxID=386627 RepID=A0AA39CGJ8_9EURO|nr:hypothetical protein H2200_008523 [Cladophialophora chaetospira]